MLEYDVNAYYENLNLNYNYHMDYEISELVDETALAIQGTQGTDAKEKGLFYKA